MADEIIYNIKVEGAQAATQQLGLLQAELKKINTERNALIKKQSEGNSLTDQEKAKLSLLTQKQAELNQQKKQATQIVNTQARANQTLNSAYQQMQIRLTQAKNKYRDLAIQNKQNTKEGRALLANIQKQDAALKRVDASMGQHQRNVGNYGSAFKGLASQLKGVLAPMLGIYGAIKLIGSSLTTLIDFGLSMAKVRAISGATGSEFEKLKENAKELGAQTQYTASEVANLQLQYAKLGFSTNEILNATEGTIRLATATGSDLGTAAEVAGATLRGFNLDTKETKRVVDVMAKSFTSSALDLGRFSESMKYVAPVASAIGIPIEKVTAQLSALADAGIHGSMAGTSLRMIYSKMGETGLTADRAFAQLTRTGLSLADANDEVGQRAQTALLVLSKQKDKVDELTQSYKNSAGAANEMASIVEDTTAGSIKKLSSAWDGLILSIGESDGLIKRSIDSLTSLLSSVTNYVTGKKDEIKIMRDAQREMNNMLQVAQDANFNDEQRARYISEINDRYSEYLPNLLSEKSTLDELKIAQDNVNKSMMERIIFAQYEDEIKTLMELQLSAVNLQYETEKEIQENRKNKNLTGLGAVQLEDQLRGLQDFSKDVIDNTDQTTIELEQKYEKMSESLGLVFSKIKQSMTTALTGEDPQTGNNIYIDGLETLIDAVKNADKDIQDFLAKDMKEIDDEIISSGDAASASMKKTIENYEKTQFALSELDRLDSEKTQNKVRNAQIYARAASQMFDSTSAAGKAFFLLQKGMSIAEIWISLAKEKAGIASWAHLTMPPLLADAYIIVANAVAQSRAIASTALVSAQTIGSFGKFAKGGIIGGNLHSSGGTQFVGSDGSRFEAERGELLTIVNRHDTERLSMLSNINSKHGRAFYAAGGVHVPGPMAGSGIDRGALREIVNETVRGIGAIPVVVSESDITTAQKSARIVKTKGDY